MIISPNDRKTYHPFTLDNGLRVLVIHDVNSEKSAASLTVNCGHFDDPPERQGMAHFVEHMLFLGTKTHPKPEAFAQFISQHGGSHNAWTATEFTSYFFDINNDELDQALSRFSHFFTEPLLAQQYVEKERHAIDAEYKLKLKEDSHRIYQVHRETINPAHPFAKFSVGNADTLADHHGESIRQELVTFHQKYYVPTHMCLVVQSGSPAEQQIQQIRTLFGNLPSRPGPDRHINEPIYLPQHQAVEIFIKPHKHTQRLLVSFSLPANETYYKRKTTGYIGHLIGFEGKGSLLSLLKRKGWCNGLSAGRGINGSNFKDFNVSFDLTADGMAHSEAIITLLFEYIALLKADQDHQTLYQDKQKLLQLAFDYQEKVKPINQVSHLSANMFHYLPEHYVCGDYLMSGFDQQEFDQLCALLKPDNMRIVHIHPEVTTDREAKWYHTPFAIQAIDRQRMVHWDNILATKNTANQSMRLPTQNPYLKNEVKLQCRDQQQIKPIPQIIHRTDGLNFWHKQDELFAVPKGHCYIAIDCPVSVESVENITITRLFTELFLDQVVETHYSAELAGLSYHLYVNQGGITIHTSGISTNQHFLIEQLLDSLYQSTYSEQRFDEIKHQLSVHWRNSSKSKPVSQLFATLTSALQPHNPTMMQLADSIEPLTFERFNAVKSTLFTRVHVDAFSYGNWTEAQATELARTIETTLFSNASAHPEVIRPILSLKQKHSLAIEKDLKNYDNAIVMYYQADNRSARTIALFMLLNHIMSPEFFHQLRTEKQLGYLVGTGYVPLNRYPGLALYIQSPNNSSNQLYSQINAFLDDFVAELEIIPAEQWHKMQRGLITQVIEKDSNLRVRSQRFWMGIGNKDLQFNERDRVAAEVETLTPADLHEFARRILIEASDAKLTIRTKDEAPVSDTDCPLTLITPAQLTAQLEPLNHN